jgi:hypothetical protein
LWLGPEAPSLSRRGPSPDVSGWRESSAPCQRGLGPLTGHNSSETSNSPTVPLAPLSDQRELSTNSTFRISRYAKFSYSATQRETQPSHILWQLCTRWEAMWLPKWRGHIRFRSLVEFHEDSLTGWCRFCLRVLKAMLRRRARGFPISENVNRKTFCYDVLLLRIRCMRRNKGKREES